MRSSTKRHFLHATLALLASALLAMPAQAQQTPRLAPEALLNLAARQQMLAERITRSYAMLQQGVLRERAEYQIGQDVEQFEKALKQLKAAAPTTEIADNYKLLEQLWGEFQQIVKSEPSEQQVITLTEQNEELGWISQQGAEMLQKHRPVTRSTEIVQTAQALRLSQRLAKLYLLQGLGAKLTFVTKDMAGARTDIMALVAKLKASPQSNASAQRMLKLVDEQWVFFARALDQRPNTTESGLARETVAKASDNLLKALEGLSEIYLRADRR